ncbi:Zinc finger PHD-finger [Penicillium taxi]|uniref:Zinc finger PHD-finger n=1 Tax=Penicillium taxi TaxID=168475 RepID=UPI0025455BA9|nr:Zinc finger PHD-finger [Penicillium taxi]KAJ5894741.1 Zinc finger PHD-finger [Penicillium taxi]
MVELSDLPGGPVTSSYAVQDRVQVAEIDPTMVTDFELEDLIDWQPCTICGGRDNEEVLLLCDGCDAPSHTFCIGLEEVPHGSWFCAQCESQQALAPAPGATPPRPARTTDRRTRRTRAQQRQAQSLNQINSLHWARVWQSIRDNLHLDLDFPFDDDVRTSQQRRRDEANQREFRSWQRRFEVAERQGANNRFRETARASLFDIDTSRPSRPRVPREPTPEPESLEEMRAWNAFERAREIENNPNAARKRKEPTASPSPEPTEPERKLKRPRTRRPRELAAMAQQNGESSRAAGSSSRLNGQTAGEPSFLSSLLKEVDEAPSPDQCLPCNSPPPLNPLHLPLSPELSYSGTPSPSMKNNSPGSHDTVRPRSRLPRLAGEMANSRSSEKSPSRGPSSAVKSAIQKMVSAALKPHYRENTVSKNDYTEINRSISRKLYARVDSREALSAESIDDLEQAAKREVQRTITALSKESKGKQPVTSDSDGEIR